MKTPRIITKIRNFLSGTRRVTGMHITDEVIRFASFDVSRTRVTLYAYGEHFLSGDVIVHGKIVHPARLIHALQTLRTAYDFEEVHIVLPEDHSHIFYTTFPYQEGMATSLEVAIKDHIDAYLEFHEKDFSGDFVCHGDIIGMHNDTYELQVTVTPRSLVSAYEHVFSSAGYQIASAEIGAHMLSRACVASDAGESCVLVDFGKEKTHIALVHEQRILEHEYIRLGEDAMIQEITDFLNTTEGEARKVHQRYGLLRTHREPELLARLAQKISPLRTIIDHMYIRWHTRDTKNKRQQDPITKIVLTGEGAHVKGFADHLAVVSRIPVEYAEVWRPFKNMQSMYPRFHTKNLIVMRMSLLQ
ncbi:MAG: pilus assembly protein PilM [Candidatus Pacebacteria bacterium]|nr:pilus assembly protein PilM [Candidatus Paceibacterota bacterium]